MAPLTPEQLHQLALELLFNDSHIISIIPESMLYGASAVLQIYHSFLIHGVCRNLYLLNIHVVLDDAVCNRACHYSALHLLTLML